MKNDPCSELRSKASSFSNFPQVALPLAFIDTVELFIPFLPRGIRQQIEKISGKPPIIEKGTRSGLRLTVHQPNIETLAFLDRLQAACKGKLSRVDIAFDFFGAPRSWFECNCLMRWRRSGSFHEEEHGIYFVRQSDRNRRSAKDIVLYDGQSKLRALPTMHFELRFYGATSVAKQGWFKPTDLISIDPRAVFEKQVKLLDFDPEAFIQLLVRKNVRRANQEFKSRRQNEFNDRYQAALPRRYRHTLQVITQNRVQLANDIYPAYVRRLKEIPYEILDLPDHLSWKAN